MVVPAAPLTPPSRPLLPIRGRLRRTLTDSGSWLAILAGIPALVGIALLSDPGPNPDPQPNPPPPNPPQPAPQPAPKGEIAAIITAFAAQNEAGAAKLQHELDRVRSEAAEHRTKNVALAGSWAKLAESLGLAKDATVEDVTGALATQQATVRTVTVDRAIEQAAAKHKVDAELTAALLLKDKVTEGVEDAKLAEVLDAKVAEYARDRPAIRLAPPRRSGPPIDPADPNERPSGLSAVIGRRMGVGA